MAPALARIGLVFHCSRFVVLSTWFWILAAEGFAQDADPKRLARELEELRTRQTAVEQKLEEVLRTVQSLEASRLPPRVSPAPVSVPSVIDITGAPFQGSITAPLTLIEFSDYECGFCRRHVSQTLPLIEQNYIRTGKVKYVFKNFPVDQHKLAFNAHQAAACAGDQGKYWEMHDRLFANPTALLALPEQATALGLAMPIFRQCLDTGKHAARIRSDVAEGRATGLKGTPMSYIGFSGADSKVHPIQVITGAKQYSVFAQALDALLAQAGKNRW
jgi:protein-disulfide isomerase